MPRSRTAAATALLLALALGVALVAPSRNARSDDDEAKTRTTQLWQTISYLGRRVGWVHFEYTIELARDGKTPKGRRIVRRETTRVPIGGERMGEQTMLVEADLEADWSLKQYVVTRENELIRSVDEIVVEGKLVKTKRTFWAGERRSPERMGEGKVITESEFPLEKNGSLRIAHLYRLGDAPLGSDLERAWTSINHARGFESPVAYKVTEELPDGNFRVVAQSLAGRRRVRETDYILRRSDGAPLLQASPDSEFVFTVAADEGDAKNLDGPAAEPDRARGIGMRIGKDGHITNVYGGYRLKIPELPFTADGGPGGIVVGDPTRQINVLFLDFEDEPSLEAFFGRVDALNEARFKREGPYEATAPTDAKLGPLAAKEVRGKLVSRGEAQEFRNTYAWADDGRAWLVVCIAPPGGLDEHTHAQLDALLAGFATIPKERCEIQAEEAVWRDPFVEFEVSAIDGWKIVDERPPPPKPGEPPERRERDEKPKPPFRIVRDGRTAFATVAASRAPIAFTLDTAAESVRHTAAREHGDQVSDITVERTELGERDALRVRFLVSNETGGGAHVIRRITFVDDGRVLTLSGSIKDPKDEETIAAELDAIAETLGPWEP